MPNGDNIQLGMENGGWTYEEDTKTKDLQRALTTKIQYL